MTQHRRESLGFEADDEVLLDAWRTLEPSREQVARIEARLTALTPRRTLTEEWIELLRVRPLFHGSMALAGAVVLVLATPLSGLAGFLGAIGRRG